MLTLPQIVMFRLGLTDDTPAEDRLLAFHLAGAATAHVERLLGYRISARYRIFHNRESGLPVLPSDIEEAIAQLAAFWFENREAAGEHRREIPFGVRDLVKEYREWSF